MIAKQSKAFDEDRFGEERLKPVGAGTMMHEHDEVAIAAEFIFEFAAIHVGAVHDDHPRSLTLRGRCRWLVG